MTKTFIATERPSGTIDVMRILSILDKGWPALAHLFETCDEIFRKAQRTKSHLVLFAKQNSRKGFERVQFVFILSF